MNKDRALFGKDADTVSVFVVVTILSRLAATFHGALATTNTRTLTQKRAAALAKVGGDLAIE